MWTQITELESEFEKLPPSKPVQTRFLKSQQDLKAKLMEQQAMAGDQQDGQTGINFTNASYLVTLCCMWCYIGLLSWKWALQVLCQICCICQCDQKSSQWYPFLGETQLCWTSIVHVHHICCCCHEKMFSARCWANDTEFLKNFLIGSFLRAVC